MFVVCFNVHTLESHRLSLFPSLRSFHLTLDFVMRVYWNIENFLCGISRSLALLIIENMIRLMHSGILNMLCPNTFIRTSEIRLKASLNLILHSCKSMISSVAWHDLAWDDNSNKEICVVRTNERTNAVSKVHTRRLRSSRQKLIPLEIDPTKK